ncbi:MAG: RluA family pseudouridine synthase [Pseudobdellovibrionaceae bacterium]
MNSASQNCHQEMIYQNKDFVVVNKSVGTSIHNLEDPINLINILKGQLSIKDFFPVHRLDKETSGIQIFALNQENAAKFSTEFQKQKTKKVYIGVLRGQIKNKAGLWDFPLTDKAEGRKNPEGLSQNRIPCLTGFEVIKSSKYFSLCKFDLQTGRQHQIRKHAAVAGHHLVGDQRYGDQKYNFKIADLYGHERMFLHCHQIQLLDFDFQCAVPPQFDTLFES